MKMLTTAEAAERLRVTPRLVRYLCRQGRLAGVRTIQARGLVYLVPETTVALYEHEPPGETRGWVTERKRRPEPGPTRPRGRPKKIPPGA